MYSELVSCPKGAVLKEFDFRVRLKHDAAYVYNDDLLYVKFCSWGVKLRDIFFIITKDWQGLFGRKRSREHLLNLPTEEDTFKNSHGIRARSMYQVAF